MSFHTYHTYGYGICVDDIKYNSVDKLKKLLGFAPQYEADINEWLEQNEIDNPTIEDYYEYDEDWCLGLASILKMVILEATGIEFSACNDFDGRQYLVYEPWYPWELPDSDRMLTKEQLNSVLAKYILVLTEEMPNIGYQSVENGG